MTSLRTLPQSFVGGELSPRMFGRPDDPKYQHGAALLRGFVVEPTGAARRAPGTAFVRATRNPDKRARLLPFRLAGGQTMHVELGFRQEYPGSSTVPGYARLHKDGATVLHSRPWSATTAYAASDLVTSSGELFRCTLANTNQAPPNTTFWESLEYVPNQPFPTTNVNTGTDEITFAQPHGLSAGEPIDFTNDSGTLIQYEQAPGIFTALTFGYAIIVSTTVIQVSASPGGAALNLTGVGTGGPHRMHRHYSAGNLVSRLGAVFYCRADRPIDGAGLSIAPESGNETHWYLEPGTGEYEIPTTLAITEDELFQATHSQEGEVLSIAAPHAYVCELVPRTDAHLFDVYTNWHWRQVAFAPPLSAPANVVATATKRGATLAIKQIFSIASGARTGLILETDKHYLVPGVDFVYIEGSSQGSLNDKFWGVEEGSAGDRFVPVDPTTGAYEPYGGFPNAGGTVRRAKLNSDESNSYVVTAINADERESQPSAPAAVTNNLFVSGALNTITWSAVPGAVRYRVYKLATGSGLYGFIGESVSTTFQDGPAPPLDPDIGITPPILDETLASAPDHTTPAGAAVVTTPRAVAHFEGRRCFGGSEQDPQDCWLTRSNTESDLSYSIPVKDTDRIHQRIKASRAGTIRHLVPLGQLLALTDTTEFRISPVNSDALTPDSFAARPQSYVGAASVQPEIVQNVLLFAGARGGHLYAMGFSEEAGGYLPTDVCERAAHLFDGLSLVQLAAQVAPLPVVWCVSSAGTLRGLTFEPGQQVLAWHQRATDGVFESVSAGSEAGEDRVYVIVRRTVNGATVRYVEEFAPLAPAALEDSWFVDAGVRYEGAPATVLAGLTHLEGETVSILADGLVQAPKVVTGGQVTLDAAASTVILGLPMPAELQTVPATFAVAAYGGDRPKSVSRVWVRVEASGSLEVGPSLDDMQAHEVPPGTLFSGLVEVRVPNSWTEDGQLFLRQADPLPLTVVSITAEMALGGG